MSAALIRELTDAGISLSRHGDRLHVEAKPGTVTPELRQRLAVHKTALLAALATPDATRARLLRLAASEGLPAACVASIPANELHLYDELPDDDLLLPLHLRARCPLCGGTDRHEHPEGTDHD